MYFSQVQWYEEGTINHTTFLDHIAYCVKNNIRVDPNDSEDVFVDAVDIPDRGANDAD